MAVLLGGGERKRDQDDAGCLVVSCLRRELGGRGTLALDARDGSVDWHYEADGPVSASPTVHDGVVYAGINGGGSLVAPSSATGGPRWEYDTVGSITGSSPAVANGTVFVGDHGEAGSRLHAVDQENGDNVWSQRSRGPIRASPAVVDGVVYVTDLDDTVCGLNTADGAEIWRFETGDNVRSSPALWRGRLFVGSDDGYVYALRDSG